MTNPLNALYFLAPLAACSFVSSLYLFRDVCLFHLSLRLFCRSRSFLLLIPSSSSSSLFSSAKPEPSVAAASADVEIDPANVQVSNAMLGMGQFGTVYRGEYLGTPVAGEETCACVCVCECVRVCECASECATVCVSACEFARNWRIITFVSLFSSTVKKLRVQRFDDPEAEEDFKKEARIMRCVHASVCKVRACARACVRVHARACVRPRV